MLQTNTWEGKEKAAPSIVRDSEKLLALKKARRTGSNRGERPCGLKIEYE